MAAATIITLNDVKARLRIPIADENEDASIRFALDAAEEYVTTSCRYDTKTASHVDTLTNLQYYREVRLSKRPVVAITSATGFLYSDLATGTLLDKALVDADEGRFLITSGTGLFPPTPRDDQPLWMRTRFYTWDKVEVAYTITRSHRDNFPHILKEAIVDISAYWYRQSERTGIIMEGLTGTNEMYDVKMGIPSMTRAKLARYAGRRAWVV